MVLTHSLFSPGPHHPSFHLFLSRGPHQSTAVPSWHVYAFHDERANPVCFLSAASSQLVLCCTFFSLLTPLIKFFSPFPPHSSPAGGACNNNNITWPPPPTPSTSSFFAAGVLGAAAVATAALSRALDSSFTVRRRVRFFCFTNHPLSIRQPPATRRGVYRSSPLSTRPTSHVCCCCCC